VEELREVLKTEDLTQTEYQGRTFEVLIKSFKTHKKFLFPAFVLFGINGYVLKNFIVFQTINKEELITSFLITVAIEFILSLFQNSVISKIRGKNEVQIMAGGTVVEDDGVIKVIRALSSSILCDLGVVIDEYDDDEALDNFEMCYSLYDMEDIDDDKLKEIFTKILQPIFKISKIYGAINRK